MKEMAGQLKTTEKQGEQSQAPSWLSGEREEPESQGKLDGAEDGLAILGAE
jgi:hypothetical protein